MPAQPYSEHGEQSAFNDWVQNNLTRHPELTVAHAIPNGAALARVKLPDGSWSKGTKQAAKLKREGLLPGILDWHLPVRGRLVLPGREMRAIGLWIEFKRPGETFAEAQGVIAGLLQDFGHRVELCHWSVDAVDIVEDYLGVPKEERTQLYR